MTFLTHAKALYRLTVVLIICAGVARIVSTYRVFNQTVDESSNIACGMQLLQDHDYFMDVKHPPLARISAALGLYLEGGRLPGPGSGNDMFGLGNVILNGGNNYWNHLTVARVGTLPFFVLACLVVWFWSNRISGKWAALLSLLVFSLLPSILAHSGFATNDMAGAATLCLALYCLTRWMENPTWGATARLGIATGLALVSKFSVLLFLPGCAAALLLLCVAAGANPVRSRSIGKIVFQLAACLVIAYFVLWAGYLFTLAPIQASRPHASIDRLFGSHGMVHDALSAIVETPVPAGRVVAGVGALAGQNKAGQVSFFLGEWRRRGWWYFFPFMFLVKTPISFLLFSLGGSAFLIRCFKQDRDWRKIAPVAFALVILILSMSSNINVGSRHILAIYPLLSIAIGTVAWELWNSNWRPMVSRFAVVAGITSLLTSSVLAHPDYLAYFNFLAADRPERIEVDSDLDWGQDLARLSKWLRARSVPDIALSYFGTTDLTHAELPGHHELVPYQRTTGWIAISARYRVIPNPYVILPTPQGMADYYSIPGNFESIKPGNGPFAWLMEYKPVERIGKSIFVYYIPPQ